MELYNQSNKSEPMDEYQTTPVTFTNTQKLLLYLKKNLVGEESSDLFSNQQMGLEVQKNLGLLMLSEVEGGS